MKISCKYCGKIHEKKYDCGCKPKKKKYDRQAEDKLRWQQSWKNKRIEIKERDKYLCQCCIRNIVKIHSQQFVYNKLEVHHARKLREYPELALENKNLITLCEYHHKLADNGTISLEIIEKIIEEQEKNTPRGDDVVVF